MSRSVEDLRRASQWLIYEIWMFRGLAKEFEYGTFSGKGVVSNAISDSFLIRVRALLGFLYPHEPHSNDVLAKDYFSSTEWFDIRPTISSDDLRIIRSKISRRVAHISHVRHKSSWDWQDIVNKINQALNVFLDSVPKDKLGSRWEKFKNGEKDFLLPYRKGGEWADMITSFYVIPVEINTDSYPDD